MMVTPSIFSDVTRSMSGKHDGRLIARLLRRLSVTIISLDLWRLRVRLFVLAQCCMWSSSADQECSLAAGIMTLGHSPQTPPPAYSPVACHFLQT